MTINDTLGDYGAGRILFKDGPAPVSGLEIWNIETESPVVRNIELEKGELSSWLRQTDDFALPLSLTHAKIKGTLRLLYQCRDSNADKSAPHELQISRLNWTSILEALDLPSSYNFDLANRKHIPSRIVLGNDTTAPKVSAICQSPPLADSFMTFALTFDIKRRCTSGFLCFQTKQSGSTPGLELLSTIRQNCNRIQDPMLIPALCFGVWVNASQREHARVGSELRKVQQQTGLLSDYLRRQRVVEDTVNFDAIHRALILQHAYLTNSMAGFLTDLGPATTNAINRVEKYLANHRISDLEYDSTEVREYVEHMQVRAATELQHRQRMLDRITMYLQVLYNLMQQEIARETKRDSSAMKSISLLTMIFLPATAIATVVQPFIRVENQVTMDFKVFWAVSGSITVCVVLIWLLWIARAQIRKRWEAMTKMKRSSKVIE